MHTCEYPNHFVLNLVTKIVGDLSEVSIVLVFQETKNTGCKGLKNTTMGLTTHQKCILWIWRTMDLDLKMWRPSGPPKEEIKVSVPIGFLV